MASIAFLHICDHAFEDFHKRPCIISIFDNITARKFPHRRAQMCVAFGLVAQKGEKCPLEFSLSNEVGEILRENPKLEVVGISLPLQLVTLHITQMMFPEQGRYTFRITMKGQELISSVVSLWLDTSPKQPNDKDDEEDSSD